MYDDHYFEGLNSLWFNVFVCLSVQLSASVDTLRTESNLNFNVIKACYIICSLLFLPITLSIKNLVNLSYDNSYGKLLDFTY